MRALYASVAWLLLAGISYGMLYATTPSLKITNPIPIPDVTQIAWLAFVAIAAVILWNLSRYGAPMPFWIIATFAEYMILLTIFVNLPKGLNDIYGIPLFLIRDGIWFGGFIATWIVVRRYA